MLYLSISFQAVNGHSATRAGVDLLRTSCLPGHHICVTRSDLSSAVSRPAAFIVVQTVIIVLMGKIVAKWGHYKYIILAGPLIMALGWSVLSFSPLPSDAVHNTRADEPSPHRLSLSGLLYYANPITHFHQVLGFEVFIGIGVAFFLQNTMIAAQGTPSVLPSLRAQSGSRTLTLHLLPTPRPIQSNSAPNPASSPEQWDSSCSSVCPPLSLPPLSPPDTH